MEQITADGSPPYLLFYSYSHKDEELRDLLDKHLVILRRSGMIRDWHDRRILPGEEWDKQISQYLDTAKIILLLISADFLASEYCYDIETKRALERAESGDAYLIPVLLRPVVWKLTPFSKIQSLPKNALPVKEWEDLDSAFVNVCEGILAVILALKSGNGNTAAAESFMPSPAKPLRKLPATYSRRRVLDAALPERVAVGRTVTLVALLRRPESEGLRKILKVNDRYGLNEKDVSSTDSFALDFPLDAQGEPQPLDLAVKIESPDFEPTTQTKNITMLPKGDSEPRIFLLTPKRVGDLFVNVELYKDGRLLTGCLLTTKAAAAESETQSVNLVSVPLKSDNINTEISHQQHVTLSPVAPYGTPTDDSRNARVRHSNTSSLFRIAAALSIFGFSVVLFGLYFRSNNIVSTNTSNPHNTEYANSNTRQMQYGNVSAPNIEMTGTPDSQIVSLPPNKESANNTPNATPHIRKEKRQRGNIRNEKSNSIYTMP